ncbi:MAG: hypothetical protein JWQ35_2616 [Bacteriovoracaceae bacterium]|nr:hypothetical protein [Bacteriovoracaceae bacterium]
MAESFGASYKEESKVKANRIAKSVALTTALGVFLVGCGGGPASTTGTSSTANPVTSTAGSVSAVAPVSSGGAGTLAASSTATSLDPASAASIAAAQSAAQSAANTAKSNNHLLQWGLGIGLGALALGLIIPGIMKGFKVGNREHSVKAGLKAGFLNDPDHKINQYQIEDSAAKTNGLVTAGAEGNAQLTQTYGMGAIGAANNATVAAGDAGARVEQLRRKVASGQAANDAATGALAQSAKELKVAVADNKVFVKFITDQLQKDLADLKPKVDAATTATTKNKADLETYKTQLTAMDERIKTVETSAASDKTTVAQLRRDHDAEMKAVNEQLAALEIKVTKVDDGLRARALAILDSRNKVPTSAVGTGALAPNSISTVTPSEEVAKTVLTPVPAVPAVNP